MTSLGRDEAAQRLGVVGDADEEQIERAFRRAVRSAHPDLGGDAHELALVLDARRRLLAGRSAARHPVEVVTRRSMQARRWRRTGERLLARVPIVRELLVPLRSRRV